MNQNVIPYYSNLFFRNPVINSKVAIENNIEEISHIDVRVGENDD